MAAPMPRAAPVTMATCLAPMMAVVVVLVFMVISVGLDEAGP